MICFAAIAPHPPIIVPGIGRQEDLRQTTYTILALERLRDDLEKSKPDTIVVISPHAPFELNSFGINSAQVLAGDFSVFGLAKQLEFKNDLEISKKIKDVSLARKINAHFYDSALDHGTMVPLYYLAQKIKPKIVHLSFTSLELSEHYQYGELIGEILMDDSKRIAVIASGDLSHRLTLKAPAGYSPAGRDFDRTLINLLEEKREKDILSFNKELVGEAGECGLRSIAILLGIIRGEKYNFELFSYEGPFGVGYMVSRLI